MFFIEGLFRLEPVVPTHLADGDLPQAPVPEGIDPGWFHGREGRVRFGLSLTAFHGLCATNRRASWKGQDSNTSVEGVAGRIGGKSMPGERCAGMNDRSRFPTLALCKSLPYYCF